MKKFFLLAGLLGLIGLAIGVYHMVETWPNIVAFQRMGDMALWRAYRSAGWLQIYAMWGTGGLGCVLGLLGLLRDKGFTKKFAVGGIIFGLCAIGISFSTMMAGRI